MAGLVRAAFHYHESYPRLQAKGFFTPMMEGDGFCYAPHIKDVPTDDGLVWGAVADEVASPIARARRNDLCFEGHWGNVGDRGRAAVEAYLEMSTVDVYAVEEHRRPFVAIARVDWLAVWLSPSAPQEQIQHDDYEDHDDDGG